MNRKVFKFFAVWAVLNLCLVVGLKTVYGQCGADGTQPCPGASKKSSKSGLSKKSSSKKVSSPKNSKQIKAPEKHDGPDYSFIIPEKAEVILKQTILDFADSIEAADFTGFRDKSARGFQAEFTPERLKEIYQSFIDDKEWILPAMRAIKDKSVQYTYQPTVKATQDETYYFLESKGYFTVSPYQTVFEILYLWVPNQGWKLANFQVGVIKIKSTAKINETKT